jgi:hypothetical protein
MRYHCPSCERAGTARIPDNFPRDKKARIRCPACAHSFVLAPGRLWPQDNEAAYRALSAAAGGDAGGLLGGLQVKVHGKARETYPLLVLPPHPALPSTLMPDLLDFMTEYTRVCYLAFPETAAGDVDEAASPGWKADLERLRAVTDLLKVRLHTDRFHLLCQSGSAALALQLARDRPQLVASLIFLEPELDCRPGGAARRLLARVPEEMGRKRKQELLFTLFRERWRSNLPDNHLRGLASLLAPGFSPARMGETLRRPPTVRYHFLTRLKIPALVVLSRDGRRECRENGLFLQACLPAAEILELDKGGAWAAWISSASFPNRLLVFLRAHGRAAPSAVEPAASPANQSLGWMLALFALLSLGLSCLPAFFTFQPAYMGKVLPLVLGSILPLIWYLLPKRMGIFRILRFRGFRFRHLLPAVLAGLLLGLSWDALAHTPALDRLAGLIAGPAARLSARLADLLPGLPRPARSFIWPPAGSPGRGPLLAGLLASSLLVFGYFQSLLTVRRARWQLLLPVLLFTLFPPAWPDLLWRLPFALGAALLFARSLSLASPFFMLAGFYAASELPWMLGFGSAAAVLTPSGLPALPLGPMAAAAVLMLLLFLATVLIWGRKKAAYSPEELYFHTTLSRRRASLRWRVVPGGVLLLFSLLAAVILVFGFLKI